LSNLRRHPPRLLAKSRRQHPITEDHHVPHFLPITPAYAQGTPAGPLGGDIMTFLPMIAIFVVFYFLLIRPQQKKAKETRAMLAALQKGDEVVTAGGIVGRISKLGEQYATLEIANGVEMNVQRSAVAQLLPKGTIKTL
jgi:preprotein translocase subunit YajC